MVNEVNTKLTFANEVINKKKLQRLMYLTFHNYGVIRSSIIADKVKNLTFHYATMSGISLSVEDLRVPFRKRSLIGLTNNEVDTTEQNFSSGSITTVERFQKVIDIWNNANNTLKDEVLTYFRESDPLNPLYIMAFSGARGNISQVRQLVGMRGLMADPQGQIIDLPIKSNFREGLNVTEYIISSYGARKGLVDTALRTADSGYLTRRLVDVAQDIIVREEDCITYSSLSLDDLFNKYKTELSLENRLIGRLLAKPLTVEAENKVFPRNTEIDNALINTIKTYNLTDVEVRSPLTCDALRSVCRHCYGWHLSYSRLIDLGEAVGILAAQSIGEPGTQLTMRTFHTGGVFSGDLTKQIRAPFSGTLSYQLTAKTSLVRTIHGEKGFSLNEAVKLQIENQTGTSCSLDIPKGAMLLANDNQKVYCNQVVAEIKKDANLILEEDRKDIYTEVSGEVFLQNIKLEESIDGEGATKKISKNTGLIWVLYGTKSILQGFSKLDVKIGQSIRTNDTIASKKIINKYAGIVNLRNFINKNEVEIINSSMVLENGTVFQTPGKADILKIKTADSELMFNLHVKNSEQITHGQTIACLNEETYKTTTGGIVYYSTDLLANKRKRSAKRIFTGSLYWIVEETHNLNVVDTDLYDIQIVDGTYISKDTEIFPNIIANISGFIYIDEYNSELVIKPGELYQITDLPLIDIKRENRFVQPGETLFSDLTAQKLSYLEFQNFHGLEYALVRPVQVYKVPQEKGFNINYNFFPNLKNRSITFRTVKRIFYKDGERVKTNKGGVDLLQTFLVSDINEKYLGLGARIEYVPNLMNSKESLDLKITLSERIKTNLTDSQAKARVYLKCLIKNNQYVAANTVIAKLEMLPTTVGKLVAVNQTNNTEMLILKDTDIKKSFYDSTKETLVVKKGDLVRVGTYLTETLRSAYSGQICKIDSNYIFIRLGRPYLISSGTVLRAVNKSLVDRSDMLATLVYDKLKTVDIVQGLPKVEEILEARKIKNGCLLAPTEGKAYLKNTKIEILKSPGDKVSVNIDSKTKVNFSNGQYVNFLDPLTDGPISPHDKLDILFNYYQQQYTVHEACKKSFKHLQLFLVNEVQRTYLSQGVQIADKHIEIIVKQMTSKVRVSFSGDTTLLPGEVLDINQAEMVTKAALSASEEPPLYRPLLLGLTKASLNSESFISAASFQETTRVLTEAAIEGKKDWLNGLKENVIIGRLIPAGTGFNCFENLKKVGKDTSMNLLINPLNDDKLKSFVLNSRLKST